MKKYLLPLIVILTSQSIFCQDTDRKFTIQTSPALFFFSITSIVNGDEGLQYIFDLEGQYKISSNMNLSLTLALCDYDYYDENIFMFNIKPMFIWRPFKTGLSGFYLGFYSGIGLMSYESKGSEYDDGFFTEIGFGLNIGYKWIFEHGITMQVGGGIGTSFSIPKMPFGNDYILLRPDGRIVFMDSIDFQIIGLKLGWSF